MCQYRKWASRQFLFYPFLQRKGLYLHQRLYLFCRGKKIPAFGKATFVMDRGYDNKMFLKLDEFEQDYVIQLTAKRKLLFHNKWISANQLRNQRKGKIKTSVLYKGKERESYLSHVKVQITASRKDIYLVLAYRLTKHPMMLAANKEITSKDDVIQDKSFSILPNMP